MTVSCFPVGGGRPRLLTRQCDTCLFRPGNPMHLTPGRLKDMISRALQQGSQGIICHDTLPYGAFPRFGPAICRGFYDQYGPRNNFIRNITRLGVIYGGSGFTEIDPPSKEASDD